MDNKKYSQEIRKTGFVLESKIGEVLRRGGWTVISNKYYEDDFEGRVREMDLLAYKVSKIQQVSVYTTLLISCKKNESNIWALLAKPIDLSNPNSDWWPLHTWSNDKAINHIMTKSGVARTYHHQVIALGVKEALATPEYEVFAFQEMNRESGTSKNDKNIFGSVISLMKAQAYELGALSQRKKDLSVYQFNLISVVDSELYRIVINGNEISEKQLESEHYISRYIIKKRETFSRIRFSTASGFEFLLQDYARLHKANCKWVNNAINEFYDGILKDSERSNLFAQEFRDEVEWPISLTIRREFNTHIQRESISVEWDNEMKLPEVTFFDIEPYVTALNANSELKKEVSAALKKVYRYSGEFIFSVSIPF